LISKLKLTLSICYNILHSNSTLLYAHKVSKNWHFITKCPQTLQVWSPLLKSTGLNVYEESVSIGGTLTMLFTVMLILHASCINKFQHYALFFIQYM